MSPRYCFIISLAISPALFSTVAPYCAETVHEIALDEETPLNFTARDLLNLTAGRKFLDWTWGYREGITKLTIRAITNAETARYIDAVAVYPEDVPDIAIKCPDRIELDVWLSFSTDDGAFNERWYTTIADTDGSECMPETGDPCNSPGSEANFSYKFSRNDLIGNFYDEMSIDNGLTVDFYVEGRFSDNDTQANVYGRAYSCSEGACYSYFLPGGHTH